MDNIGNTYLRDHYAAATDDEKRKAYAKWLEKVEAEEKQRQWNTLKNTAK